MMQDSNTTVVTTPPEPAITTPIIPDPVINTPPPDEGVENTKPETDDATFLQLFGKSAEQFVDEEVVKQVAGIDVTMTEPATEANNPLEYRPEATTMTPTTSEAPTTPVVETPTTLPNIDDLVNERVAIEVQKFKNIDTFFEEYQKDPYAYMSKHSPHLFKNFNEVEYVQSKMAEEFGEFTPDPARAFQIGTTDYNYVQRQNALLAEAQGLKNTAESTITAEQSAIEQSEQNFKAAKAQALGLDMTTFESRVWAKLKGMDSQSVLDTLVDAVIYKEKLREKTTNIQAQVDLTKVAPSPSNLAGTGRPVLTEDKELNQLKKMFGDEFD